MFVPLPRTQFMRDRKKSAFRHVRAAASVTGNDSAGGRNPSADAGLKPATAAPNWDSILRVWVIDAELRPRNPRGAVTGCGSGWPYRAYRADPAAWVYGHRSRRIVPQTIVCPSTKRAQRANNARSDRAAHCLRTVFSRAIPMAETDRRPAAQRSQIVPACVAPAAVRC